jgi:putative PIG3 family NAD(P)H quinone oxidoreductase
MTAMTLPRFGGPEVLDSTTVPLPAPGPGEVLIKVAAAGVNRPDVMQRQGHYPPPAGAPDWPGLEVAGTIVAVGDTVNAWHSGDEVCALLAGGGYAEYCAVPQEQVLPVPRGLSLVEAAALPETYFTVYANVMDIGQLQPGERFLVHGGSSGIGTTAIQMARAFGADVYTTAGSLEKCALCEKLGASAINYRETDFVEEIQRLTDKDGVDVILDMVGGSYIPRNLSVLRPKGRHVSIAFLESPKAEMSFLPVLLKRLTLTGSTLRPRSPTEKGALAAKLRQFVWPLIEAGSIRPVIDSEFPLADAGKAHERMESSVHMGKIMLRV